LTTRVFRLAKELGVTSKAIIAKCRANGLNPKNHMALLSTELEAVIGSWFASPGQPAPTSDLTPADVEESDCGQGDAAVAFVVRAVTEHYEKIGQGMPGSLLGKMFHEAFPGINYTDLGFQRLWDLVNAACGRGLLQTRTESDRGNQLTIFPVARPSRASDGGQLAP
jgi:hypothetical protein